MTGSSPPVSDSHGGPDQHQPRPDVRWVRHRPSLGPLPRWGLVAALVLLTLVIGYRLFLGWVDDQMTPEALPGDEVEFSIVEGWSTNDVVASLGDAGVVGKGLEPANLDQHAQPDQAELAEDRAQRRGLAGPGHP